jgi:hypothetical protein
VPGGHPSHSTASAKTNYFPGSALNVCAHFKKQIRPGQRFLFFNFIETAAFVSTVSRTSEVKPTGMAKLGDRLQNVSPEVRTQFIDLTQQVASRARQNRSSIVRTSAQR